MMRLHLVAAGISLLAASPAMAQPGAEAVADILACDAVRGTKARLSCFEAALPALRAAHPAAVDLAASRAEAARAVAARQAAEEFGLFAREEKPVANDYERDAFGANDLPPSARGNDDDEVKSIEGLAVEIGKNNLGKLFVILDNGQVWRQVSGDRSTPYIPRSAEGLPVEIKKGAMGSYFVKVGKSRDAFRAERIK